MIKERGRFTFPQFVKDKLTRWEMKLGVLADSKNGYMYDFEVYTGKGTPLSKNGLAYDFAMRQCKSLQDQEYHAYFDSFYTVVQLLKDLIKKKEKFVVVHFSQMFPQNSRTLKLLQKAQENT